MSKIYLNDLLQLTEEELRKTKVRLNTHNGTQNPIDLFKQDPKKLLHWNYYNNKSYKIGQYSIGLVNKGNHNWLLFTIGEITDVLDIPRNTGVGYTYNPIEKYSKYFGRVVVKYENKVQQLFRNADSIMKDLEVIEILPSIYTGIEFPGYDNISLNFEELNLIINSTNPSYRNALENQKAVYLITDKSNGRLYVGSATAQYGMLLSRWKSYNNNGHGHNVELRQLVNEVGFDHVKKYFQYSVIENYNQKVDDYFIIQREQYWKRVLDSKHNGYNSN